MSKNIPLSPKHGVNPIIPVCFWCGKEKNEIALLGKVGKEDVQAPMHMVLNYDPCDECKENWEKGVALLEITERATDNRPPMTAQGGLSVYPTGRYLIVRPEVWTEMTGVECKAGDKTFIDPDLFNRLMGGGEQ